MHFIEGLQILHSNRSSATPPDFVIRGEGDNNYTLHYRLELPDTRPSLFQAMHQSVGALFYISEQRLIRPAEGDQWRKERGRSAYHPGRGGNS